jgi:hypothetical protein
MIINPVTMRSTLKARGRHAASASIMIIPPMFSAPDQYRFAAPRERTSDQENRQRFAKQHRNNAAGRVFAAKASAAAGVDARFVTALSTKRNQTSEPGKYPGPLRSRQKFEMLRLKDQRHSTLVIS